MKTMRLACLTVLASAFLGTNTLAQAPSVQQIKVLTLLGRPLQFVVADKQGIFAKYGVEVETENLPNSDVLRGNLAAGRGDFAYLAVDNAVAMVELAHQDLIIGMGCEGWQNGVGVKPEIKSIKDLRGKTLIVDAPDTAYALQLRHILSLSGLKIGDYEFKPIGSTPQRLIAMREHKEYAGSMLGPPSSIVAKREGFVSLGSVQELIGPYQAAGFFALRSWAQEHRNVLIAFLAAIIEAQRWLMAPVNKQQVIELWIKEFHLAPEAAAETYQSGMTRPGGFEEDAALDLDGFRNVLQLPVEFTGMRGGTTPLPDTDYGSPPYCPRLPKLTRAIRLISVPR